MDPPVIEPSTVEAVAEILARASREKQRVSIQGAGTKLGWGAAAASADIVLSTRRLNAIIAHRHGDLTATVQAGATLADVNRALARHRQWIPLDPPFADRATIGGIVATNDSGPRRHRYGAPRDLIIGADFVRADGTAAKAGGIVVKNVAGYDVARLLTGSFGCLAIIVSATFKLYPLPQVSRTVIVDVGRVLLDPPALVSALLSSQLTPTAVELQVPPGRMLIRFETIEAAADQQAAAVVQLARELGAAASVVQAAEEMSVWDEHAQRPWNGPGAVLKITLLPSDLAATLTWMAEAGLDYEVIGRAGVGVLLARLGGDAPAQARALSDLRARLDRRGSAVVVRASDELKALVDVWGSVGDALPLMRAVKERFDPAGILSPGRGPAGL